MTDRARFLARFRHKAKRLPTPLPEAGSRDALLRTVFGPRGDLVEAFAAAQQALGLKATRLSRGRLAYACRREAELAAPRRFGIEPAVLGHFPELDFLTAMPHYLPLEEPRLADLYRLDLAFVDIEAAVAETGSLVIRRLPGRHRWLTLTPDRLVAILRVRDLLPTLVDCFARESLFDDTRALVLATGPSKTADIEMELVIGVHGPKEVHAILVED